MYSSRGTDAYGKQQPYSSQSSYTPQSLGGSSFLGGGPQESELGGYRAHGHPSAGAAPQLSHYGGQYSSVYGSSGQQVSSMDMKGSASTGLEGRSNYAPSIMDSPKFGANEYVPSSSRGYGQKIDQLYPDRISEYPSIDRSQYPERRSAYLGRDLLSETASRRTDSVTFGHEHQSNLYDRLDQVTMLRQEQMLMAQTLQSASGEGGARQSDYLAARATVRAQDPIIYGGRVDSESRSLLMLSGSTYGGQHATSILGAAPQRTVDDLLYAQSSSNPGYGVSLPPGRDYGTGKGLSGSQLESNYPGSLLGHSHLRVDDRNDDRSAYGRDMERRDKDRDYLRDREDKEREKDRLRERERERRERERERERVREREREREKERERERDRREKERDRELKRGLELKRDLTPSKVSRDHRGSSQSKDIKTLRRESPRREASHRLYSPVRDKRREYVCKVFAYKFVDEERDYLSLDKRYPRLYISPECSKVVVCWPKKNQQLSLYTPVSFEHDFVEETTKDRKESPSKQLATEILKAGGQTTIWNAKVILMSGLSQNALAELSSERVYDDRVPHFCNMLRFAILKKNSSLMAIGGPWDSVDGGDPSVDDSSLIQTALRYAKDVTYLDLKNCLHWNRFLEIHYHRVGKDGLFSHKEVTVLFVPDLSECLPSLELWRNQWLNHKKVVSKREQQQSLKKEISGNKEEGRKDKKKADHPKDGAGKVEPQKKKELSSSARSGDGSKKEKDANKLKDKGNLISEEEKKGKSVLTKDVGSVDGEKSVVMKVPEESSSAQKTDVAKPGKKKIVKRIVKRKVSTKKGSPENANKKNDELDKEDTEGENLISGVDKQLEGLSPPAIKTFIRKKVVKKPECNVSGNDESMSPEVNTAKELENAENKAEVKSEDTAIAVTQEGGIKTKVKKKVIKRVPKRKAVPADTNSKSAEDIQKTGDKIIQAEEGKQNQNEEPIKAEMNEVITPDKKSPTIKQIIDFSEKQDKKEETTAGTKGLSCSVVESDSLKHRVSPDDNTRNSKEKKELKDKKETKALVQKNDSKSKENKVVKEKTKSNEPPRHPGLILQTEGCKDTKSLSLSLDSLLDYKDTDIEESTFELSLFAESLYEMLQYEMGCRLLDFLQKLRIKFVSKRKQGKRQREETSLKKKEKNSSSKRAKTDEAVENIKSTEVENNKETHQDDNTIVNEGVNATEHVTEAKIQVETLPNKIENKSDKEDDPLNKIQNETDEEEDPEEDEEMPEASPEHELNKEKHLEEGAKADDVVKADADVVAVEGNVAQNVQTASKISEAANPDARNKDKVVKIESETKGTPGVADNELLQAFRFFDRNRAGYVRVEDLRLIIHNLGRFLSHRDVKELVQSALLESSTGRDDRILYDKLVRLSLI